MRLDPRNIPADAHEREIPLYVPLTAASLDAYLDAQAELDALAWYEIPGLLTLYALPQFQETRASLLDVERFLARAFEFAHQLDAPIDTQKLVMESEKLLDRDTVRQGLSLLSHYPLYFLSPDEAETLDYLTPDRLWDFDYSRGYHFSRFQTLKTDERGAPLSPLLTDEQYRTASTLNANIDDHMHIEGYAGTGKSYELNALICVMTSQGAAPKEILVLTYSINQKKALATRLPSDIQILTHLEFVRLLMSTDANVQSYQHLRQPRKSKAPGNDQYAKLCALPAIGSLSPSQVAQACVGTVRNYCHSDDETLEVRHIPPWTGLAPKGPLSALSDNNHELLAQQLVFHARYYWQNLFDRKVEFLSPNQYQLVKFAALQEWGLPPALCTHILVDESHDLTPAMLTLMDRLGRPVISLGDRYQNLDGKVTRRSTTIRHRDVFHAVRAGAQMDNIVNPILQSHPVPMHDAYKGDTFRRTVVEYYVNNDLPPRGTTLFVGTLWGLFAWAQRLAAEGLKIRLLDNTDNLNRFASDVIELYLYGHRAGHPLLVKFRTWDHLVSAQHGGSSFQAVARMLEKGYQHKNWQATWKKLQSYIQPDYILGTVFSGKNSEYDQVYLTRDLLQANIQTRKNSPARASAELYVATTRVRYRLYAPVELRNYLEESQ